VSRTGATALACGLVLAVSHAAAAGPVAGVAAIGDGTAASTGVAELCTRIGAKLASVSTEECLARGLAPSGARSVRGRAIASKVYPPLDPRVPRARVLLVGGIHGDEYSSVSVVFKWMRILDEHHSGLFHWQIAPLMNPDGLLRPRSQRMNENGVDLNRNFPTPDWFTAAGHYWNVRTGRNPRRYPGPAPLSEPESRWLAGAIERFRPDAIVAVHAPHGIVDFDGPPKAPHRLGHLHLNLLGTYPGSLGNYAGAQRAIPVVTIELPHAGIMPSAGEIDRIWTDLVRWLLRRFPERSAAAARLRSPPTPSPGGPLPAVTLP